jgi:acetyl-CoA carboxylase, biotin carboxylase subunit
VFRKVLIANRGEIAVRIIRACRELGVKTVVAHSEADRLSLAVSLADEAICVGPATSDKSYLNIPNIVSAALVSGAEAIHPGYGFLSENAYLAEVCDHCGITFVGPTAEVIEQFSDKSAARKMMRGAGLPVIPGVDHPLHTLDSASDAVAEIGYPVMIKACAGGGGRGLRVARDATELARVFPVAQMEAQGAFGSGALYLEALIENARHVEVQVLVDRQGNSVHLGERDCSLQRRHQKILEETPCPAFEPEVRDEMCRRAAAAAAAIGYVGVGTVEFLVDRVGRYYFMEMNTRIQVEHPISEMTTGIDLVKWQLRVAAGEELGFRQDDVVRRGHSIECRINAEDPRRGFAPQSGLIGTYTAPGGPGVRVDSHLFPGYLMPPYYDSLLAKVIVWGGDRQEAILRVRRALDELRISGVVTNVTFQLSLLQSHEFVEGSYDTGFVERWLETGAGLGVADRDEEMAISA